MAFNRKQHRELMEYLGEGLLPSRRSITTGRDDAASEDQDPDDLLSSAREAFSAGNPELGQDLLSKAQKAFAAQILPRYHALDVEGERFRREATMLAYCGNGQELDGNRSSQEASLVVTLGKEDDGRPATVDLKEAGNLAVWAFEGSNMLTVPIAKDLITALASANTPEDVRFVSIGRDSWFQEGFLSWAVPPAPREDRRAQESAFDWLERTLDHRLENSNASHTPIVALVDQMVKTKGPLAPKGMLEKVIRISQEGPSVGIHLMVVSAASDIERIALFYGTTDAPLATERIMRHEMSDPVIAKDDRYVPCFWAMVIDDDRSWLLDNHELKMFIDRLEERDFTTDVRPLLDDLGTSFKTPVPRGFAPTRRPRRTR